MKRARFILEAVGSRGDIGPLLNLAGHLLRRGQECHMIAPEAFRAEATALGLSFHASTLRREAGGNELQELYFPSLGAVLTAMRGLATAELPTIVVNIDRTCASNLVAEQLGLPTLRLTLCPFKVRSLEAPPWPWAQHARGPMGRLYLKHTYPSLLHAADHDPRLLDHINGCRRSLGLPPVASAYHPEHQVCAEVALFPAWFAQPASDWPRGLELAGFEAHTATLALPARLEEFLQREPRPIVFTGGTAERDVEAFFRAARQCCEQLGRAGVFLSSLAAADTAGNPRLLAVDYADLAALLPRASAFVHHGGIGGTARAFAAGVPQVISPRRFDQPDNARRAQELGVAAIVPRELLSGPSLASALQQLEASREVLEAVRRVRDLAQQRCGAEHCAEVLVQRVLPSVVRSAWPRSSPQPCLAPALPAPATPSELVSGKTIVMIVWPEAGHIASPLALAKQLRARGDRVLFAGLDLIRDKIVPHGFEFRALAQLRKDQNGIPTAILWAWTGDTPLAPAFAELSTRVDALLEEVQPDLVLIDSLYSLLGGLFEGRTRWASYETDLPREADPIVPPPHLNIAPRQTPEGRAELRTAWAQFLLQTARRRATSAPEAGGWNLGTHFPDQLCRLIRATLGRRIPLHRNVGVAPVAKARRLIFCPQTFDFERSRTSNYSWVDPCIDLERSEPDFDWGLLPAGKRLIYCAQGTQSFRNESALHVLRNVIAWVASRADLCMIMVCPPRQRSLLSQLAPTNCILVERAPQLAVLRRADAAIVHGGFNTLKECVAFAVPMLVVPLSHDQPRNAALVETRGVGLSADPAQLTPVELERAMNRLLTEPAFRAAVEGARAQFRHARGSALTLIAEWLREPQRII
jgi:UDP:flavonoid glycosyltransferase YjiC (YdhE family)